MKRIVLVACCGEKLPHAALAKDLYQSQLFKLARNYAERVGDDWFILSAKLGLVRPDDTLMPYDQTFTGTTKGERAFWAGMVVGQTLYEVRDRVEFIILAGRDYRDMLEPALQELGHKVTVPMRGLGIGQQLQFLSRENVK